MLYALAMKTKSERLVMRIDPDLKVAARIAAKRDRRSLGSLISILLDDHLKSLHPDLHKTLTIEGE